MIWDRYRCDEARNRFSGKINIFYTAKNNTSDGFATKRNEDELTREKILVRRIGERAAAKSKDF